MYGSRYAGKISLGRQRLGRQNSPLKKNGPQVGTRKDKVRGSIFSCGIGERLNRDRLRRAAMVIRRVKSTILPIALSTTLEHGYELRNNRHF